MWNGRSVVMETVLIAIEYYRVNFLSGVECVVAMLTLERPVSCFRSECDFPQVME